MSMPSTNERWAQEGRTGGLKGAPKVTVILNLFMREVSTIGGGRLGVVRWVVFTCPLNGDVLSLSFSFLFSLSMLFFGTEQPKTCFVQSFAKRQPRTTPRGRIAKRAVEHACRATTGKPFDPPPLPRTFPLSPHFVMMALSLLSAPQVLTEQLDSLFEQTTASHIAEVWVCVFSAPAQDYALRVVKESKYKNVRLVVSDFNFKFYGRFQVSGVLCGRGVPCVSKLTRQASSSRGSVVVFSFDVCSEFVYISVPVILAVLLPLLWWLFMDE